MDQFSEARKRVGDGPYPLFLSNKVFKKVRQQRSRPLAVRPSRFPLREHLRSDGEVGNLCVSGFRESVGSCLERITRPYQLVTSRSLRCAIVNDWTVLEAALASTLRPSFRHL